MPWTWRSSVTHCEYKVIRLWLIYLIQSWSCYCHHCLNQYCQQLLESMFELLFNNGSLTGNAFLNRETILFRLQSGHQCLWNPVLKKRWIVIVRTIKLTEDVTTRTLVFLELNFKSEWEATIVCRDYDIVIHWNNISSRKQNLYTSCSMWHDSWSITICTSMTGSVTFSFAHTKLSKFIAS